MIFSKKFERDNIKPCIHLSVGELLFSEEASKKEENDKSNCKVVVDNEKTHLSISFDGETHGLIFVNRAKKANKGNCLKCKSIRCSHIQKWNKELKNKVLKDHVDPVEGLDNETELQDDRTSDDGKVGAEDNETIGIESHQKLHFPLDRETQEKMQVAEDYFKREAGEILTEVYSNFPILRERAVYKRDCKIQDKKQRRDSCEKDFPAHSKLTPVLYLLTCGCPQKSVIWVFNDDIRRKSIFVV